MAEVDVKASSWKTVQVGRVALFMRGIYAGRLATIIEIVDHKRVLVDGPSGDHPVPRHSEPLSNLILTPLVLKIPRAIGRGPLSKAWEKEEIESKWSESAWFKTNQQREKRRNLTDFERFKVMRLRKQARFQIRRAQATERKAA
ncbi:MAG: hypothetical protein LQ340_003316 [Diploschistes diacapsis]|nr:MAG: hypothetical protein LQ340_003316 [Diploschistes diacapsis]